MTRLTHGRWIGAAAFALVALVPGAEARAQDEAQHIATAAALYEQAAKAMAAGDYASACPKLEEAAKLEPDALGAKLALAECYEGAGRLASAWGAFLQVEAAAAKANQLQRQKVAHTRAERLKPWLAQLVFVVPDSVKALPGLQIQRDGEGLGQALFGVALPIDKGKHVVVVTANGKKRREWTIQVNDDAETLTVKVNALLDATPVPPPAPPPQDPSRNPIPSSSGGGRRVHIWSDDPSAPLALYRVESDFTGIGPSVGYGAKGPTFGVSVMAGSTTSVVCRAPCDEEVAGPSGQEFFLGGQGITPSSRFQLDRTGGVDMKASPGSVGRWWGGVWMMSFGVAGVVGGAIATPIGVSGGNSGFADAGGAMLGIGAVLMAIGIPLIISGKTTYSFDHPEVALRF